MKTVVKSLKDLRINDLILEFVVKDTKLRSIPKKKLESIKQIFNKKLTAIVKRDSAETKIIIKDLLPGDSIIKIFSPNKKVTGKFLEQLKEYQLNFNYLVALPSNPARKIKTATSENKKRNRLVTKALRLVDSVQDGMVVREKNRAIFESFMWEARTKKPDLGVISEISDDLLKESPETMALISLLKASDQTFAHCIDCGPIFRLLIESVHYKYPKLKKISTKAIYVIACLHDIGKVKISADLLDSTTIYPRESEEMQEIKKHPMFGFEILRQMNIIVENKNLTTICALVARNHHVKIISDPPTAQDKVVSYPLDIHYETIDLMSKLFAPVDIYQAIIGNRSYQEVRTPPSKAMELLKFVNIDQSIKDDFKAAVGIYPIGTPVRLNSNNYGFVIDVPRNVKNLNRPEIVIFHSSGQDITHCEILDLSLEDPKKFYIEEDLDPHLDFKTSKLPKTAMEYFTNIQF